MEKKNITTTEEVVEKSSPKEYALGKKNYLFIALSRPMRPITPTFSVHVASLSHPPLHL